jgi:hypothetical protein
MSNAHKTIHIEPLAPAKPAWGAPCNGCGICCLVEPCPVGMVLSARRRGACDALHWDAQLARYQCGALVRPGEVLREVLPRSLRGLSGALAPLLAAIASRAIAVGVGCDCDLQVVTQRDVPGTGRTRTSV